MVRFLNAFTAFLMGSGVLVLVVGLFGDAYPWGLGVVGLVALWVVAFALRVYLVTADEDEEAGRSRRQARR
jgi:hypothetical protein